MSNIQAHNYGGTYVLDDVPADVLKRGSNGAGLQAIAQELNVKAAEVTALNVLYRQMRLDFGTALGMLEEHDPAWVAAMVERYGMVRE